MVMSRKKLITNTLLASVFFSTLPYMLFAIDQLPPIPVSDSALRDKEAGLTIFGYTLPGLTWDSILIVTTKITIAKLVDSTVKWINNGFEGNPAFVTDPKQYFTDLADGIAGEFIQSSEQLGFLCSPFQANIRLSLAHEYSQLQPFQCTLTEVVDNVEDFYKDFSKGGWDAWFSMSQNPTNNPFGSYLKAKAELDSRIARAVGLKSNQLDRNQGFLDWQPCAEKNPPPFTTITTNDPELGQINGTVHNPKHVAGKAIGECIKYGPIQTPGTVINTQLANVLGTGVRQLELADGIY